MTKKLISLLLCIAMVLCLLPTMALAAEGDEDPSQTEWQVSKSKTAEPTELDPDDPVTTMTLSLPSGEYKNKVDIVFVMDNSTSVANAGLNFSENVSSLFDKIVEENPGIDMKIGVVKFRGFATDMLGDGLVLYDDSSKSDIVAAISNNNVPGSGSNVHSGLVMADELLEADTEVDNDHKYVILLTDCKSYIWNNDAGEPTAYYAQFVRINAIQSSGKPVLSQWNGIYNKELGSAYNTVPQITEKEVFCMLEGKNATPEDAATSGYYEKLYNCGNDEIASTSTVYDFPAYYSKFYPADSYNGNATTGDGTVTERNVTNATEIFGGSAGNKYTKYWDYTPQEGTFWESVRYLQTNPYEVIQNEDGQYVYDTSRINEDFFLWHPSGLEKGIYQAGHYWSEEIDAKYNAAAITLYKNDGTGDKIVGSFQKWFFENSDYSADVNKSDDVIALFEGIDNSIRYLVSKGTVTDEIGDDFDMVVPEDGSSPFTFKVGGEELAASETDEANTWNYGEPDDEGIYPYVITYTEGDSEKFEVKISVPIENVNPIEISYDLRLTDEAIEAQGSGTTEAYDTNKSAVLDYTTTDGTTGSEEFEVPQVTYEKPVTYLTIEIPFTKEVKKGGSAAPKKQSFEFELSFTDPDVEAELQIEGTTITTSGVGTYDGTITITVGDNMLKNLQDGVSLHEIKGSAKNWKYDETEYTVTINDDGTASVGGAAATDGTTSETEEAGAVFTNVYTANITPPSPPELDTKDHYGYIVGYPDGTVQPQSNITRAEVATIFFRLLTEESRQNLWSTENSFSDVSSTDWFNNAISTLENGGIVEGYPDGTFRPAALITRAELATMAVRFLDSLKNGYSGEDQFPDISDSWAREYINIAAIEDLINGYEDGTFRPTQPITRAETMAIINRLLKRAPDKDHLLDDMIKWPDNMDENKWYYAIVQEATNSHSYDMGELYEIWTALQEMRDWAALEKEWSTANSSHNPGNVMP